jgi:carboxypeptidase C (cathepsin A)
MFIARSVPLALSVLINLLTYLSQTTRFLHSYQKYKDLDFHISGESYAGTYLPNIAHVINKNTLALREMGSHAPLPALHFKSVLIGNGLTDPLVQVRLCLSSPFDREKSRSGPC